jgi:transcriptional regulator GlxA family with amidase domain
MAGVGRRTLVRAFRAVRNTTPSQFLRTFRLNAVREALLSANGSETVTQIVMNFGVRELGRFASEYRSVFGESPSETLGRRADAPVAGRRSLC